jgi:hypothetical protein
MCRSLARRPIDRPSIVGHVRRAQHELQLDPVADPHQVAFELRAFAASANLEFQMEREDIALRRAATRCAPNWKASPLPPGARSSLDTAHCWSPEADPSAPWVAGNSTVVSAGPLTATSAHSRAA